MSRNNARKSGNRLDDHQTSEHKHVNAYGVRYATNLNGNGSKFRLSHSVNHVPSSNATSNMTRRGFNLRCSSEANRENELLSGFLNKMWRIYSVSRLECFDSSPEELERRSKLLDKGIRASAKDTQNNITYSSKFLYSSGCPAILCLEVNCITMKRISTSEHPSDSKLVYEGQFYSWDDKMIGDSEESCNSEDNKKVSMPLLLCRSSRGSAFIECVQSCVEKLFDISISGTSISQEEMTWLTCLACSDSDESEYGGTEGQEVRLSYGIPLENCKPCIYLSFDLDLAHQIWKCVHRREGGEGEVLPNEVMAFMQSIEEHSLCSFGINLIECELLKVELPSVTFSSEGMVKIASLLLAERILRFLADICVVTNTFTPSLGFSVSLANT